MVSRIIDFSARNPFTTIMLMVAIVAGGVWAIFQTPLDAIPDLSDVPVIIYTPWEDRSPDIIEDQVTYPIVTQLLSAPRVKAVRANSFYGFSLIYVIFEDRTDLYWARSRVLEYLSGMIGKLPSGVAPQLGPDATGVGWGLEYALIDKSGKHSLAELRSLQDWNLQYQLRAVPGVAEVAPVGAFVKQYQVTIDPDKLLAYDIPINRVVERIRKSNQEVGGRVIEFSGREYMVRGRGYIKEVGDIEEVSLGAQSDGTPIRVRDVGFVQIGPDIRRGVVDYNGLGDAAGGVVVVRFGESVYDVLQAVKKKLHDSVEPSLPEGVELKITYDRSELIEHSVATLREGLIEEFIIVSLVCVIFLFHFRSALVAILSLPLSVLLALLAMRAGGLTSNIMSLGGLAIAVGDTIDAMIVMVENAHKRIEQEEGRGTRGEGREEVTQSVSEASADSSREASDDSSRDASKSSVVAGSRQRSRQEIIIESAKEVGPSLFVSQIAGTISFLPILFLEDQEGRLFRPLVYTDVFGEFFGGLLTITVVPFLMTLLIRGRIRTEEKNPVNRFLIWAYKPAAQMSVRWRKVMVLVAVVAILAAVPIYLSLGSEFMPPLWEETIMYMPVALPGASIETMREAIQRQDQILMSFPEVASVFAKAGRAETATDPAPLEMIETIINLKPPDQWRKGLTHDELTAAMDQALRKNQVGFSNSWTMPIKGRIDMLATGIRTPVGLKIFGPDLKEVSRIGGEVEKHLAMVQGTRSAFAERVAEGYYLDFTIRRDAIARYGLTVGDVQEVIQSAVGGANVTTTIEGRERYPINVRYGRAFREDLWRLRRVLVETPTGIQVPLDQLANLEIVSGPSMIKSEAAQLVGYVYIDVVGRDPGGYVQEAKAMIDQNVKIPNGYRLEWSGAFEAMQRVQHRMLYVIPLTLLMIFVLLYLNTPSLVQVLLVFLTIPFALVGAFLFLYLLNYNLSAAVWVGLIGLAGVSVQIGLVLLMYVDMSYKRWKDEGRLNSLEDLQNAVVEGAVQRIRPTIMTVMSIMLGLLPIMWSTGTGADMMKRVAAPMVGGIITAFLLTLLTFPALYTIWKRRAKAHGPTPDAEMPS